MLTENTLKNLLQFPVFIFSGKSDSGIIVKW